MGNCLCRLPPPATWADDDGPDDEEYWADDYGKSAQFLEAEKDHESPAGASDVRMEQSAATEVRIRINKKQLEEVLRRAQIKGFSAKDLMADLICRGHVDIDQDVRRHPWKPALQSITEEPERLTP